MCEEERVRERKESEKERERTREWKGATWGSSEGEKKKERRNSSGVHRQRFLYNEIHYLIKNLVETIQRSIESVPVITRRGRSRASNPSSVSLHRISTKSRTKTNVAVLRSITAPKGKEQSNGRFQFVRCLDHATSGYTDDPSIPRSYTVIVPWSLAGVIDARYRSRDHATRILDISTRE